MSKTYVVSGYYGYKNSGDESLLLSVIEALKESDPGCEIIILSKNKKDYVFNDIQVINRFNFFSLIKSIKKSDMLIMGGGSLLQDKTSNKSLYYYLTVIYLAIIFGKKTYMYANGLGPICRKFNRKLSKLVLDKVSMIVLRDLQSSKLVDELGIKNPKVITTADPVFALAKYNNDNSEINKNVAIIIRNWDNFEKFADSMAKFCDYLINTKNKNCIFIALKSPEDVKAINLIRKKMKSESKLLESHELEDITAILKNCSHCYSMRLHGIVYSALCSLPVAGLSYDIKVKNTCTNLSMPCIDFEDINFESLLQIEESLENTYSEIKSTLINKVQDISIEAEKNKKLLEDFIKSF